MEILFALYLAHFLGDYLFQTDWVYRQKQKSWCGGLYHALGIYIALVLIFFPVVLRFPVWFLFLIYAGIHYVQDGIKIKGNSMISNRQSLYILDQLIHFLLLTLLWWAFLRGHLPGPFWISWKMSVFWFLLLGVTFVWDVSSYVFLRADGKYERNGKGMIRRTFALIFLWVLAEVFITL